MKIRTILNSGNVVRFHAHTGIDKQKTSEHQWGVAIIVQHISPSCSKTLLLAALTHDAAEYYVGDAPANVKWHVPEIKTAFAKIEADWEKQNGVHFHLTPDEHTVLKMADMLEGMHYCVKQARRGHRDAKRPFRKWRSAFYEMFSEVRSYHPYAFVLLDSLVREMEEL